MNKKQLTVVESACIITGYGIGGGVMAMPYLAQKNGVVVSLLILAAAFGASFVLHVMIAELAVKSGGGSQIIEVFSRYLFQGKYRKALTAGFLSLWRWYCLLIWRLTFQGRRKLSVSFWGFPCGFPGFCFMPPRQASCFLG
ncbi:MAG: aromatic amino acid transport family protein [Eisenbergiella massiliensis]